MSAFKYEVIEQLFIQLFQDVSEIFTITETQEVTSFIEEGEYGLALETFVDIVIEENKRISPSALKAIEELASAMQITSIFDWDNVRKFVI